ncbi:UPF0182 family protein [Proteinivorax hydrogeniformans]|uniref:UPF0182 protein PRVXH_000840 n=1 Tax=Proteinivorax hydrogeniformans TaxID=1826727 RepID=A0AAU8HVX3_9FIRM
MKKATVLGTIFGLIILFFLMVNYYTEYLWYASLDITEVMFKPLIWEVTFKILFWAIGFAFLAVNFMPLVNLFDRFNHNLKVVDIKEIKTGFKVKRKHALLIAGVLSLLWMILIPSVWDRLLLALNATPTGNVDPIHGLDISFYLFQFPIYELLAGAFLSLLVIAFIGAGVSYFIVENFNPNTNNVKFELSSKGIAHLSVLVSLFLVWFIVTRSLQMYGFLLSDSNILFGAGYTDVNVRMLFLRIQQVLSILFLIGMLVNVKLKKKKIFMAIPISLIVVSLIGGIYAGINQRLVVSPDEESRETPYIAHHLQATKEGFNLDNINREVFPLEQGELSRNDLKAYEQTLNNIRLLDYRPLKQHYHQNQSLRLYYEFNDIDIDRYTIDGEHHQVMLSVRELDSDSIPTDTPLNRHFKYTHGHGVVMSPVNTVTSNGHPTYFMRNLPVETEVNIDLNRPEIYFGEMTDEFVVVKTEDGEISFDEKEVWYEGADGVELNPFRRLLYTVKYQKPILMLSNQITEDSRILYNRNIVDRVNKVAPFIELDEDPYPVVANGRVYWIIDGYTTSSNYPYSQPVNGKNYIRNSVKIVVDAYDGTVDIYQFENEPIIEGWKSVFPDLIQPREDFPPYLEEHIRYPLDLFDIQRNVLTVYHTDSPRVYYNADDIWEIPVEKYHGQDIEIEPYYITAQLPNLKQEEFLLINPFTPRNRNNMNAWLAAGNDGDNYGELFLYTFPPGEHIEGPSQVEAYIDQDPDISQQITLWGQGGSTVVRGNLLTIPIESSMLYVEPLYIISESRSVPEMRQVLLFYNDVLVMERTLDAALDRLFGVVEDGEEYVPYDPDEIVDRDLRELVIEINTTFKNAEESARQGNWAEYGSHMDRLAQLLTDLENEIDVDEFEQELDDIEDIDDMEEIEDIE